MSLSLVEFPLVPLTDIPARLRLLAEQIEDDEFGEVVNIFCVVETATDVRTLMFGGDPDQMRARGILGFAAQHLGGDDE